jgi:ribosomal protein L40E
MPNLLPVLFIVFGACALILTLYFLWQSLRGAFVHSAPQPLEAARTPAVRERMALLDEKHALLMALKDLENERESGKLSEGDFKELNGRYRSRARDVLRALDAQLAPHREAARSLLRGSLVAVAPVASAPAAVESGRPNSSAGEVERAARVTASALADTESASQAHACPSCSVHNEPDAVFCKKCGTRLPTENA